MKLNLTPDMILPCIYAFFASFGFSYVFNLRGKNMFYAALGGGLSWFVYLLFAGCFPAMCRSSSFRWWQSPSIPSIWPGNTTPR